MSDTCPALRAAACLPPPRGREADGSPALCRCSAAPRSRARPLNPLPRRLPPVSLCCLPALLSLLPSATPCQLSPHTHVDVYTRTHTEHTRLKSNLKERVEGFLGSPGLVSAQQRPGCDPWSGNQIPRVPPRPSTAKPVNRCSKGREEVGSEPAEQFRV